jgi:glycosyltransferase involved in cell wall biosynthesis
VFIEHNLKTKSVPNILKIIGRLRNRYSNLKFVAFGIDKYNKLPSYVDFVKNPDDNKVREIYSSSDIFIGASESEGFYLSPAEAMACKCAVVVSKIGAVPEYSTHLVSAMHFEPGNINEMFNHVCYLIDNPDKLRDVSENGYREVRNKLDWNKSIERFEELIFDAHL